MANSTNTEPKDIHARRRALAEDILRFRTHYPAAKLLAFYCWASEEDGRGRMRCEREKTWSTGRRLVLFTTKATLPEGWQQLFPEFAAAYAVPKGLFDSPSPGPSPVREGEAGANVANVAYEPHKPHEAHELSEENRQRFAAFMAAVKCVQRPQQQLAYFDYVALYACTPELVTFAVPSRYVMEYIEKHLIGVMVGPFKEQFGRTARLEWRIQAK